ncbi:MAG TPA: FAD-dependent oxidoreductase [Afifellaceae bacterium]|nr:FAD-dependent oxidoreductase [Afifellaceae bacterium]
MAGTCDIAIIGAGIAGASVAAELAASAHVVLIEREPQPGYHSTGRSAAVFSRNYGPPTIRCLSRAAAAFLDDPPSGFAREPLLAARGVMMVARTDQLDALETFFDEAGSGSGLQRIGAADVRERVPLIRGDYAAGAIVDERACDIDVHGLHQGYLKTFKAHGGEIVTGREVVGLSHQTGGWHIAMTGGELQAAIVINAAGAWADTIATLAGALPLGLEPRRRTVLTVAAPAGYAPAGWPMTVDIDECFYLKPESGRLLISPADETPSPPCDAQPEEIDIAVCIDRIEAAFDINVERVETKWAGLRTFLPDRSPAVGFDRTVANFFWLAGQGGYGIQTAPALARYAAALVRGDAPPADIDVDPAALDPARFAHDSSQCSGKQGRRQ